MDLLALIISIVALVISIKNRPQNVNTQNIAKSHNLRDETVSFNKAVAVKNAPKGALRHELQNHTNQKEGALIVWLKKDPLMKLGIFFVSLAFAWFVSYAYIHAWIGYHTVIFSAIFLSGVTLAGGFWDAMSRNVSRGLAVVGLGNFMFLASVFAGRFLYDMFSIELTFVFMLLPTAFSTFAAYKFNSSRLIFFVYLAAVLVPFLLKTDTGSFFALFSYLLLINIVSLSLVYFKKWHILVFESFVATVFYSLFAFAAFDISYKETLFAFLFAIVFTVVSYIAIVRIGESDNKLLGRYLAFALANTVFIALWTLAGLHKDLYSASFLLWSFFFLLLGFSGFVFFEKKGAFYVFSSSALLFLGFVTINEFDFEALLLAFTFEAALAAVATYYISKDADMTLKALSFYLVPAALSGFYLLSFLDGGFETFNLEAVSAYVFLSVSVTLAIFLRKVFAQNKRVTQISDLILLLVGLWTLALIWIIPHAEIYSYGFATLLSIAIYALIGLALYFNTLKERQDTLRKIGVFILIMVSARVSLVDVWNLSLIFRIMVFALVGLALMATAYKVSHRKGTGEKQERDLEDKN